MIRGHPYWTLFWMSSLIIAFVFWRQANWWVSVDDEPEPILKFELPLWIQLPVSLLVGLLATGVLVGVVFSGCRFARRFQSRSR